MSGVLCGGASGRARASPADRLSFRHRRGWGGGNDVGTSAVAASDGWRHLTADADNAAAKEDEEIRKAALEFMVTLTQAHCARAARGRAGGFHRTLVLRGHGRALGGQDELAAWLDADVSVRQSHFYVFRSHADAEVHSRLMTRRT